MRTTGGSTASIVVSTVKDTIVPTAASIIGTAARPAMAAAASGAKSVRKRTSLVAQLLIFWPLGVFLAILRSVYAAASAYGAPRILIHSSVAELRRFIINHSMRMFSRVVGLALFPPRVIIAVARYLIFLMMWAAPAYYRSSMMYRADTLLLRSIPYGPRNRHRLDIYLPREDVRAGDDLDVVAIYSSAGWSVSKRATCAAFARALSDMTEGLVVVVELGTHPQVSVADMIEDVRSSLRYIQNKIGDFGGSARRIHGVGISAGAHLLLLSLLGDLELSSSLKFASLSLVSGVYDPAALREHAAASGMFSALRTISRVFPSVDAAQHYSVDRVLEELYASRGMGPVLDMLPEKSFIFHGSRDNLYPVQLVRLHALAPSWRLHVYKQYTHNEALMEALLCDGQARLVQDLARIVVSTSPPGASASANHPSGRKAGSKRNGQGKRRSDFPSQYFAGAGAVAVGKRAWVQMQVQMQRDAQACPTWSWWAQSAAARWLAGF